MKRRTSLAGLLCVLLCCSCATATSAQWQASDLPPSCRPDYDHCVDSCSGREVAMESANVVVGCLVWILTLGTCAPRPVPADAEAHQCVDNCNSQASACINNAPPGNPGSPAPATPPEASSSQSL